jgi:ribonuclease HII
MILGIDEVGRGPWAGPLVIGAVVLGGATIEGLTDSKKLSKKRRTELDIIIREQAAGYGLGWVTAQEIDEIGLSESLKLATRRAVEQVKAPYHEIIIDGTINFLADTSKGQYVTTLAKADLLVPSVSAASIIAKVARDNYMTEQDAIYEGYKFASHVGYGTVVHRGAIEKLGVTPLHRLSFAPLAKYRDHSAATISGRNGFAPGLIRAPASDQTRAADVSTQKGNQPHSTDITTKKIGDEAEDEAANHLVRLGHEIIERNWKTKYCEIDIVSHKDGTVYFTEVKYRKSPDQGGGIAAITTKKLNQMKFAAKLYAQSRRMDDHDLLLAVMTLTGKPPAVEDWITLTES